ncbi:restriction endonuclease subunit S [Chryseobacterium hispalense]|uniref:restriction endonuclease subunit S n=1 Tax=Chryseobacterium hispalense TaxID=1453492 RepID=UPI0009E76630|nr:restriction endonuclease subunit S [Chryseobacterium hispalense]
MEFLLKDICFMKSGGTPKKTNDLFYGGKIPWVTISDFKNAEGDVIYKTDKTLSDEGLEAINGKLFKKDSLLLAMYGSIGKTAILGVDAATNQAILSIVPKDENVLNIKYLKYWLDYNKNFLNSQGKGAILKNISLTIVQHQKINLPDLESQNKIVAILDKAKSISNNREITINKYDELLRSIFLSMFGDPVNNPNNWNKISLSDLGIWKSGGTPSRSNQRFFEGNIPWVTSGELNELYIDKANESITQEAIINSNSKIIPKNSLLIGMYDTAALKSSINTIPLACNQAIAYCTINEDISRNLYVHTAIQIGKEYFKSNQRGVRQQNLNLGMIRKIKIPNPPLEKQLKYEIQFKKIINCVNILKQHKTVSENLIESLANRLFSKRITIDMQTEFEALINAIDLNLEDADNKIDTVKNDVTYMQLLIDNLAEQKFENIEQYDKAKYILFRLMNEEKDLIKQIFKNDVIQLTLTNETT